MAKPTYKVWVANLISLGTTVENPDDSNYYFAWDKATLDKTVAELKSLFDDVCKHASSAFASADVTVADLPTVATGIKPGELLVRFTSKKKSAVVAKYGAGAVNNDTRGATKDTGSGVVSEAWLEGAAGDANVPGLVARLAFHELMHNKLDASNSKNIHAKPDDGTGLALPTVSASSSLTNDNKLHMAQALGSSVTQFTGPTIP